MTRRIPIFSTIVVIAAVLTMIGLGIWQLGRKTEKEALIARYKHAQAAQVKGDPQLMLVDPSSPDAAYTRTLDFCGSAGPIRAVSGRNGSGQSGWVHVARCEIGGTWNPTQANCEALHDVMFREFKEVMAKPEFLASCVGPDSGPTPFLHDLPKQAEIVLGWSQSPEPAKWKGGFVTGTVVPSGEFGFKIVADPPLAGLQPNAKPDPGDLPNNHLAFAVQWFFFAATAFVIYVLAIRRRRR